MVFWCFWLSFSYCLLLFLYRKDLFTAEEKKISISKVLFFRIEGKTNNTKNKGHYFNEYFGDWVREITKKIYICSPVNNIVFQQQRNENWITIELIHIYDVGFRCFVGVFNRRCRQDNLWNSADCKFPTKHNCNPPLIWTSGWRMIEAPIVSEFWDTSYFLGGCLMLRDSK